MNDTDKLAESIVSAQCSYDTAEHKAALIEAFKAGIITERNNAKRYVAVVEPYEGGSAYIRGWRAALGALFGSLKRREMLEAYPPQLLENLLDTLNTLAEQPSTTQMLDDNGEN